MRDACHPSKSGGSAGGRFSVPPFQRGTRCAPGAVREKSRWRTNASFTLAGAPKRRVESDGPARSRPKPPPAACLRCDRREGRAVQVQGSRPGGTVPANWRSLCAKLNPGPCSACQANRPYVPQAGVRNKGQQVSPLSFVGEGQGEGEVGSIRHFRTPPPTPAGPSPTRRIKKLDNSFEPVPPLRTGLRA